MYTFVHPTKTGGTAVEQYFRDHHPKHVKGVGHLHTCANSKNPIVIVRHPVERFVSMYRYWRDGAVDGKYKRDHRWTDVDTIAEFIRRLDSNDNAFVQKFLHRDFTTDLHFCAQAHWLKRADHAKTIVVVYDRDGMDDKLKGLLGHLGLPPAGLPMPKVNVTVRRDDVCSDLGPRELEWISRRFKEDFDLWHLATKHPGRFKKVF